MVEKARILVVDDDESIRNVLKINLEEHGYSVETASTGEEAAKKMASGSFNLALIDVKLPDIEGTRLLSSGDERLPRMVKIILTGYPTLNNAIQAVNSGADGYLLKPVRIDELLRVIEVHLKRQREAKEYSEEQVAKFIETRAKEVGYRPRASV